MVYTGLPAVDDPAVRSRIERAWGMALDPKPGLTVVVEIMTHAINQGKIRGMYIMGENPAMSDPDVSHARKALAELRCWSCRTSS